MPALIPRLYNYNTICIGTTGPFTVKLIFMLKILDIFHRLKFWGCSSTLRTPLVTGLPVTGRSFCCALYWNVTLEYATTHSNVMGHPSENHHPTFYRHQRICNLMIMLYWQSARSSIESERSHRVLNPRHVECESNTLSAHPQPLLNTNTNTVLNVRSKPKVPKGQAECWTERCREITIACKGKLICISRTVKNEY